MISLTLLATLLLFFRVINDNSCIPKEKNTQKKGKNSQKKEKQKRQKHILPMSNQRRA